MFMSYLPDFELLMTECVKKAQSICNDVMQSTCGLAIILNSLLLQLFFMNTG